MHVPPQLRAVLFHAAAASVAALVQTSMPDRLFGVAAKPDLLIVLPVLAGSLHGPLEGALVGVLCGYLRDALAGRTIGAGMLLGLFAGLLAGVLFAGLLRKGLLSALLQVAVVGTAAHLAVEAGGLVFIGTGSFPFSGWGIPYLVRTLPLQAALDLAAAVPLFFLMKYAGPHARPKKGVSSPEEASRALWT